MPIYIIVRNIDESGYATGAKEPLVACRSEEEVEKIYDFIVGRAVQEMTGRALREAALGLDFDAVLDSETLAVFSSYFPEPYTEDTVGWWTRWADATARAASSGELSDWAAAKIGRWLGLCLIQKIPIVQPHTYIPEYWKP